MKLYRKIVLIVVLSVFVNHSYGQQDPQFTQYMYNTMTVNPAYAGSQAHSVITLLGRTQWIGFDGSPDTQSLSFDTPLDWKGVGLGINLMNDKIGPTNETYADLNVSYAIQTSEEGKLAFGLKGGARFWNLNRNRLTAENQGALNTDVDINNKVFPTIGAGIYYYTNNYYLGVAVPNMLNSEHYDERTNTIASERFHFFGIMGYVFNLSDRTKFKPAALVKAVQGAPVSIDISANFLFNEKLHAGLAWRWDDSISALLGFQVSKKFHIGYAYDLTTSAYKVANDGTHELFVKYHFMPSETIISPRFF